MEQTFTVQGFIVTVKEGTYCDYQVFLNGGNISDIFTQEDGTYAITNGGDWDYAYNETIQEAIEAQFKYDSQLRHGLGLKLNNYLTF